MPPLSPSRFDEKKIQIPSPPPLPHSPLPTCFDEKDNSESSLGDDFLDSDVVLPDGEALSHETTFG